MDTGPDTGIPDPISTQESAKVNGHMSPRPSPRIPTPHSPRSSQDSGLDNMSKLGSVHPLKDNGLDSMGKMAGVAPFSRSPADVGLGSLGDLGDNLPFPSRASHTPKPDLTGQLPKRRFPRVQDIYVPATPAEDPFVVPTPPRLPRTPREIALQSYNILVSQIEPYMTLWNNYEDRVGIMQAELRSKGLKAANPTLDMNAIMDYIQRVRERDVVLEKSYSHAREMHMKALEDWASYRSAVVEIRK